MNEQEEKKEQDKEEYKIFIPPEYLLWRAMNPDALLPYPKISIPYPHETNVDNNNMDEKK